MPDLRPMTEEDAEEVFDLAEQTFGDLNARLGRPPTPPRPRGPGLERFRQPVRTDPGGCWVAEDAGRIVGAAQAIDREGVWGLSLLIVDPLRQSQGTGKALIERTLDYAGGGRRGGIILSSEDPRALRRYARAGFRLDPSFEVYGPVRALPERPARVRTGGLADVEDADAVGRAVRGAGHGPDLPTMLAGGLEMLHVPGEGFALHHAGDISVLAARDEAVARDLLRAALAAAGEKVHVGWITSFQRWAVPVLLDAGLELQYGGAVCTRGDLGPFSPYLPSGAYL